MIRWLPVLIILSPVLTRAQITSEHGKDTTITLQEITVRAFEYDRKLLEVPAAVAQIGERDFDRFNHTSFVPAINTIPGVRMEERSPGSYRLSIRGSTLRSPFGIRNVKIYFNGLPFTDPGGNTYLNLLDFNSIQQAEIIKGPGGSLYGAGTGGVLIMNSRLKDEDQTNIGVSLTGGTYGLLRYSLNAEAISSNTAFSIQFSHQQADGYREQSKMIRDAIQVNGHIKASENSIVSLNLFYTDLYYQTPGGLNKAQYDEDPQQARPPAGPNPGAVEQQATVYNKTFFGGVSHEYKWNNHWSNTTGIYGTFTQFDNPSIRNYEKRVENSFGGRTNTQFKFLKGKLNFGAEFQQGFSPINVYDNNAGVIGALQSNDEINSMSAIVFSQIEFFLPHEFFLTLGGSLNLFHVNYDRLSDTPPFHNKRNFDPEISPRIALLKKLNSNISIFGSISQGFSPPTVAELYPSTATFNDQLNPEKGTNYELGLHSTWLNNTFKFDVTGYSFQLRETIVVRRTSDGADYFVNAGSTSQKGIEVNVSYNGASEDRSISFSPWLSYTYNHYRFSDYMQDVNDYSGNELTGVPSSVLVGGIDFRMNAGLYGNINYTYTSELPLDDANTAFADPYNLLGMKIGYRFTLNKNFVIDVFGGVDNLLDEKYSLGNDLNAFGGRYYNAAPLRNFYFGIRGNVFAKND